MRSAGGTKSGEPCFVTRSTKVAIAFLVAVSFHDGSGSVTAVCASRETGRSIGSAARANIARRLTSKTLSLDVIIGSLCVSTLQPLHSLFRTTQRNPTWLVDVSTASACRAAGRVFRNAAGLRCIGFVLLRVPVAGPFPDVANHVVNAVAVRRKRGNRRRALEAVVVQILSGKFALPCVGLVLAAGHEFLAPGILRAVQPATRSELPFCFGRQIFANPTRVSDRIRERHVHHRMMVEIVDVALWSRGVPPVGALQKSPPLSPVAQIDLA